MYTNFSAYYEAIILEDAHIQSKTFKVTIPSLFSTRKTKDKGEKSIKTKLNSDQSVMNAKEAGIGKEIESTTIITALNHTDYTFQLKGDVFKMEKSKGKVMDNMKDSGGIPLAPGPLTPHYHKIDAPFKFYNFIFENLNNVKVKKGTKCYGFFINGENNPDKFAVVRIEGAIPLTKGKAPKYVK